jgi:hypothetical protein
MVNPKDLKIGMQIAMVPAHAGGNLEHPDVQFGFVTQITDNFAFCRYFLPKSNELRTKSHSIGTSYQCIEIYESHSQDIVYNHLIALYPECASSPEFRTAARLYGIKFSDSDPDEYEQDADMGINSCSDAVECGKELGEFI